MKIRQTSLKAYSEIDESIGNMQLKVLNCIRKYPRISNKDIGRIINMPINSVTPRTNELVKGGKVCEAGKERGVNGRLAIVWAAV